MRIDAHQHFWTLSRNDYGWLTPDLAVLYRDYGPQDLAPLLRDADIDRSVLVQAAPTEAETHYLLGLARTVPFVAGVVGWSDMAAGDAPARIEALAKDGGRHLLGLRPMIQDIPDPEWVQDPKLDAAFRALVDLDLSFDALVRPEHLDPLLKRLARHPDLRVVIDHGAKPDIAGREFGAWAAGLNRIAKETGAHCKLSGLVTEAGEGWTREHLLPYVETLFDAFGPSRIMWGSDWPVLNLCGDYSSWAGAAQALTSRFGGDVQNGVFGENAAHFYKIAVD